MSISVRVMVRVRVGLRGAVRVMLWSEYDIGLRVRGRVRVRVCFREIMRLGEREVYGG